jgi:MraZ protein
LDKKCVLIGQGKKFEIWDEKRWTENQQRWLDEADDEGEMPSALESLSF